MKVIRRLSTTGHVAYIVGGAIRDLLLGKSPKDFDIATDASPSRIRKVFRNSRIIGKRFRLVHVLFKDNTIEVSTFRARSSEGFKNVYGKIDEDVRRRDFTLNALYYSPEDETLLDYVGGLKDIRSGKVRAVIPLESIFEEDPVRMIRAVKYAVTTSCRLERKLKKRIGRSADLLSDISASRMTEEVFKILQSGFARPILEECVNFGLLPYMVPNLSRLLADRSFSARFFESMQTLDEEVLVGGEDSRDRMLAYFCSDYLYTRSPWESVKTIPFDQAFGDLKRYLFPVTPANRDVEQALGHMLRRKKKYRREGSIGNEKAPRD
jgi:poly(A) polymerase